MIVNENKIKNCKILSIRYKILKSNLQKLRSLMYTLVEIKSGKDYKLLIIHKREIGIHYRRKLCARCLSSLLKITPDFEPRYLGEKKR